MRETAAGDKADAKPHDLDAGFVAVAGDDPQDLATAIEELDAR